MMIVTYSQSARRPQLKAGRKPALKIDSNYPLSTFHFPFAKRIGADKVLSFNDKISLRQLQILLILDIFGAGVIFLPRIAAEYAEQDAWICIILATLAVMFFAFIMVSVAKRFPNQSFVDYTSKLLSRPIGILLSIVFVIKMTLSASFILRFFVEISREILLENTPFSVVGGIMLIICAYSASKGLEGRARLAEILIFVVILPLIFVCIVAASDVDFSNVLPIVSSDTENILRGGYEALFAFTGLELCMLIFPRLNKTGDAVKSIVTAAAALGFLMTVITVVAIAKFGPFGLKRQLWPVLEMMDAIDSPGSLLERQGALVMSFWIVSVFASINAYLYHSSIMLKEICKKGKHSMYILILLPVIFGLSFFPSNIFEALEYINVVNHTLGAAFIIVVPAVLLIVAKLRKAGAGNEA